MVTAYQNLSNSLLSQYVNPVLHAVADLSPQEALSIGVGLVCAALAGRRLWRKFRRYRRGEWAKNFATLSDLQAMTPNEFEEYAAACFEARGWHVEIVGKKGKPDGGLDLLLTGIEGRRVVVQCKRYRAKVGAAVVRETVGVMFHHEAHSAFVVALSGFTKPAHDWAIGKPVRLIHGLHLLRSLKP